ncbi:MAG: hypothetical protein AAB900_02025 [Patescibacteria group bacterium]
MTNFFQQSKLFFFCLSLLIWVIGPAGVWAADSTGNTFTLSPARQEVLVSAGQTKILSFKISNRSTQVQNFVLTLADLNPTEGGKGFVIGQPASSSPLYIFSQLDISLPIELTVSPGEIKIIPVAITIPADWPPISVHGLVNFSLKQIGNAGANAQINTSAGAIILLRAAGQAKEQGQLLRFNSLTPWLGRAETLQLQVAYQNAGNVYLNPYGVVTIKNWRGRVIGQRYLEPLFVLPQAIRNREVLLAPPGGQWWPGFYRAQLELNLGFNNQVVPATTYFFVNPGWFWNLGALLIVLGGLYLGFKFRKHV